MSYLPQSLASTVKRFQSATTTSVRLTGDRSSYSSSGVANFKFAQSGVLDLASLALLGTINYTSGTAATTQPYNSMWIRRCEFVLGGQQVSLQNLQDSGFVNYLLKAYTQTKSKSDYMTSISNEGNLTIPATTAASQPFLISDWLGLMSGAETRFLPLSLLPPLEINIMFHDSVRWTVATTTCVLSLTDLRLQYSRLDFADGIMENMWNSRLSNSVITIPFTNISYAEGSSIASTSSAFTTYINTQSLEYIVVGYRAGDYDSSYANRYVSHCGDTTTADNNSALTSLSLNGTPLTNYQIAPIDAIWGNASALSGQLNALYAPDFGTASGTFALFKSTYFALFHRVGFPIHENENSVMTGLSTGGMAIPIDVNTTCVNGGTAKKAFVICIYKSTIELGAGRQIAVAL